MIDNPVSQLTQYELRHLIAHLEEAGRAEDVHRLLALETANSRNAWHSAREAFGDTQGLLADVARGRRLAEQGAIRAIAEGAPARDISLEIRYALMVASLRTLAGNMPPSLLSVLPALGVWTCEQAVAYGLQIPDLFQRSEALANLATVCDSLRDKSMREALTAAQSIEDLYWREGAIALLAPYLSPGLLRAVLLAPTAEAFAMERAYSRGGVEIMPSQCFGEPPSDDQMRVILATAGTAMEADKANALRQVAPFLPVQLLDTALALYESMDGELQRTFALGRLVPRMVELGLASEAKRFTQQIGFIRGREVALERLERHDLGAGPSSAFEDKMAFANSISDPYWQAVALVKLSAQASPQVGRGLLIEALNAARTIGDSETASQFVKALVTELCVLGAFSQAFAELETVSDEQWRAKAIVDAASYVTKPMELKLWEESRQIRAPVWRAHAMVGLVDFVRGRNEVQEAVQMVKAIDSLSEQFELLSLLVPKLSRDISDALLASALNEVKALGNEQQRAGRLATICRSLPAALIPEAYAICNSIDDQEDRSLVLAQLVVAVAYSGAYEHSVNIAGYEIKDGFWRELALQGLCRHLIETDQFDYAMTAVGLMTYEHWKAEVLGLLASHLPLDGREQLVDLARTFTNRRWRAVAFMQLYSHLPVSVAQKVLRESLELVQSCEDQDDAMNALLDIAPLFPSHMLKESLAWVDVALDQDHRDLALSLMLPQLARLGEIHRAIDLTTTITSERTQGTALAGIIPNLPETLRYQAMLDALAIVRRIQDVSDQVQLLNRILPFVDCVPAQEVYLCWREVLSNLATLKRAEMLESCTSLIPILSWLGGGELLQSSATAIRDIGRWWP